jgi:hypothetical protein
MNLVDDTTAMICPDAVAPVDTDLSYLQVNVRDQFNAPMGGVQVDATFDGADIYLTGPVTGFTDGLGDVTLYIYGGTDGSAAEQTVTSGTEVTCLGVVLYSNDKDFLSPDMSQAPGSENYVEGLDYAMFAANWLSGLFGSRSNFDRAWDDAPTNTVAVGGLDYAIFALHWLD